MQRLCVVVTLAAMAAGCTMHHSTTPIADARPIKIEPGAKFVSSDDSGLAILGLFLISEPDHYAVLIERIRRRYNCAEIHHAQLDSYSDFWFFVSFPILRITAICDQARPAPPKPPAPKPPPPPPPPPPETPTTPAP